MPVDVQRLVQEQVRACHSSRSSVQLPGTFPMRPQHQEAEHSLHSHSRALAPLDQACQDSGRLPLGRLALGPLHSMVRKDIRTTCKHSTV